MVVVSGGVSGSVGFGGGVVVSGSFVVGGAVVVAVSGGACVVGFVGACVVGSVIGSKFVGSSDSVGCGVSGSVIFSELFPHHQCFLYLPHLLKQPLPRLLVYLEHHLSLHV